MNRGSTIKPIMLCHNISLWGFGHNERCDIFNQPYFSNHEGPRGAPHINGISMTGRIQWQGLWRQINWSASQNLQQLQGVSIFQGSQTLETRFHLVARISSSSCNILWTSMITTTFYHHHGFNGIQTLGLGFHPATASAFYLALVSLVAYVAWHQWQHTQHWDFSFDYVSSFALILDFSKIHWSHILSNSVVSFLE